MKKIRAMLFTVLLTVMMSTIIFPVAAFAGGGENIDTTPKLPEESIPVTTPLTPDGNLTLVDDIKVEESKDKQFVTLQSKNGNYFYLVIDRSGDKENVYFLNLVDEADLMALIEDNSKKTEPPKVCTCSEKCEIGNVNSTCPVCTNDLNQCVGKASAPVDKAPEKKSNAGSVLVILLLVGGLGGAFYFLKMLKNKQKTKGDIDPLDYDYDEDEDEDDTNETEEDYETEDDPESEDDVK